MRETGGAAAVQAAVAVAMAELTFAFSGLPPGAFPLSLSTVAEEGLAARLCVQAITAAHGISAVSHTHGTYMKAELKPKTKAV